MLFQTYIACEHLREKRISNYVIYPQSVTPLVLHIFSALKAHNTMAQPDYLDNGLIMITNHHDCTNNTWTLQEKASICKCIAFFQI